MANLAKIAAEKKLRAQGYIPASEVATKTGLHVGSIYRWISDGEVDTMKLGNKRFIRLQSVVAKIGADAARALGLVIDAQPNSDDVTVEVG